jgi:ribosomal protein S18 acetylase RimI-like enzyme
MFNNVWERMLQIERLTAEQAVAEIGALTELLQDAVDGGASVGFLPPLTADEARRYWEETIAAVGQAARVLLVARQDARVIGTVQLDLPAKPNARHRAEVQKLIVHTQARGQGVGSQLMSAVEAAARAEGRTLLVLDTRQGDVAEPLYAGRGYIRAGVIPHYARSADGALDATVLFYRLLED